MFYQFTRRLQRLLWWRISLLSTSALDEIVTGFAVIGTPLIRDQFGLSYSQIGLLFTASTFVSLLLGPVINILSDLGSKRYWILGGFMIGAICDIIAGTTTSFAILLLVLALNSPVSGAAIGLSQAALIDEDPQASTRTMLRWTQLASIGDLLSPLTVAFIVSLHLGWSALCWVSAVLWLAMAIIVGIQQFPTSTLPESKENKSSNATPWSNLRTALHDPVLLRWSLLTLIPTMMNEIFLSFATLYLHDSLHIAQASVSIILAICMLGSFMALYLLDHFPPVRRIAPQRLLVYLALFVLVNIIVFLSTRLVWLAAITLFLIHLGAAGWYPLAKAQAYARYPGRSGLVRAIISLGAPLEAALPGIVGIISGQFGLLAGLSLLALAPVFILALTLRYKRRYSGDNSIEHQ